MDVKFNVYQTDCFNVGENIYIGITPLLTEDELRSHWKDFRNLFIHKYQDTDISDFTRWNFYLFYVVQDKKSINQSLKYEIEHNTISSRKIVVNVEELDENAISLIGKYIKFAIEPEMNIKNLPSFQPNAKLKDLYNRYEDQED